MKRIIFEIIFIIIFLAIVYLPSNADENPEFAYFEKAADVKTVKKKCESLVTTVYVSNCAWGEFQKADKILNTTHHKYLENISYAAKNRSIRSEKAWLKYENNTCFKVHDSYGEGTGGSIAEAYCRLHLTNQRIAYLRRMRSTRRR